MRDGMRKIFKIMFFAFIGGSPSPFAVGSDALTGQCQAMSGAHEGVQYCQTPIYSIFVKSEQYNARHVATFGYLLHEGGGRDVLGASPDVLRRIDFISCIDVDLKGASYERSNAGLSPGIYFVMVQGKYTDGAVNGACVGSFSEAYISRISKVPEGD